MSKILMVLKTQNLRNDQRVLKEIKSLTEQGANVNVFVSKDCDTTEDQLGFPMKEIKIIGGAAPNNLIIRLIGVFQFYIKNILYFLLNKKNIDKAWICDPIMFGLVALLKLIKPKLKIIWDHHELPPSWFLNNKFLMKLFKIAYIKSDIVIHTNESRMNYLENNLNICSKKSFIISNYPEESVSDDELLSDDAEEWIANNEFIYLQNSLQDNRFGAQVINSAIANGILVFHAGKIDKNYIEKYKIDKSKIFLAGYLNPKQMNRALKKCKYTVILYKKDSLNQVYCDANRLYQAMSLGVYLVIGDNPTMVETVEKNKYRDYSLISDVADIDRVFKDVYKNVEHMKVHQPVILSWSSYNSIFKEIVNL